MLRSDPGAGANPRLVLRGARITGQLDLSYARIAHPIILRECDLDGPVIVSEARLSGLILDGCTLPAIEAPNLELDGDLGLRHVSCARTVNLKGAHLHHDLQLQGARLGQQRTEAYALVADHMTVDGSVYCHDAFAAVGALSMVGARVRGTVRLDGARIIQASGPPKTRAADAGERKVAFNGEGITVGREFSAHRLHAAGEFRLIDAAIVSTLELRGARLDNPGGIALRLDRAEISSSLYCDDGFRADGEVCAIGAHFNGTVYFNDAEVGTVMPAAETRNPSRSRVALRLVRVAIDGDLGVWRNFTSHGKIILTRSSVAGELTLLTTNLKGDIAADLTNARFGTLTITGEPPTGLLDLTRVKADVFRDHPERWREGNIVLNGFEYTSIHMDRVPLKVRYQWLRRGVSETQAETGGYYNPRYLAQPYEQLAKAYRRVGDDHAARLLLLEKYRQRNRATTWQRWYSKIWYFMQDMLIGYGYTPFRALIWLTGLFVLGVALFRYAAPPVWIGNSHHGFTLGDSVSYTLDLLMPISSLSDRQIWHSANGTGEILASALVMFGWILGATVIAGAARVLQRS